MEAKRYNFIKSTVVGKKIEKRYRYWRSKGCGWVRSLSISISELSYKDFKEYTEYIVFSGIGLRDIRKRFISSKEMGKFFVIQTNNKHGISFEKYSWE